MATLHATITPSPRSAFLGHPPLGLEDFVELDSNLEDKKDGAEEIKIEEKSKENNNEETKEEESESAKRETEEDSINLNKDEEEKELEDESSPKPEAISAVEPLSSEVIVAVEPSSSEVTVALNSDVGKEPSDDNPDESQSVTNHESGEEAKQIDDKKDEVIDEEKKDMDTIAKNEEKLEKKSTANSL